MSILFNLLHQNPLELVFSALISGYFYTKNFTSNKCAPFRKCHPLGCLLVGGPVYAIPIWPSSALNQSGTQQHMPVSQQRILEIIQSTAITLLVLPAYWLKRNIHSVLNQIPQDSRFFSFSRLHMLVPLLYHCFPRTKFGVGNPHCIIIHMIHGRGCIQNSIQH